MQVHTSEEHSYRVCVGHVCGGQCSIYTKALGRVQYLEEEPISPSGPSRGLHFTSRAKELIRGAQQPQKGAPMSTLLNHEIRPYSVLYVIWDMAQDLENGLYRYSHTHKKNK